MPQVFLAFAGLSAALTGGGSALTLAAVGVYGFSTTAFGGALIAGAVSIGLNFLASVLFRPKAPQPEDVQSSVRQPAQPRRRGYGRVLVSGPWVFAGSKQGEFHKVVGLGCGPIDGFERLFMDDTEYTVDANGDIVNGAWFENGFPVVNVQLRLGATPEAFYPGLAAAFPVWTSAHRGDGIASLYALQRGVSAERFYELFPNGINTLWRTVIRDAKVTNFVSGAVEWSENAPECIQDYMRHATGMRLPGSLFTTPQAVAGWLAARAASAGPVPLAAGGTEPRYRIWGSYFLNERPADVLARMLSACDGRLYPTPDGGLTLSVGVWEAPTVTIGEDDIVEIVQLSRGRGIKETANTITATFCDPAQLYQTTDADPWVDEASVTENGEIVRDIALPMAPSHAQVRRLMKIEAFRAAPDWLGTFVCGPSGLKAAGERRIRVVVPRFGGLDVDAEVIDFSVNIDPETKILQGCTIQWQAMPEAAYAWTPDQEGEAPVRSTADETSAIPVPGGLSLLTRRKAVAGAVIPFARLGFAAAPAGLTTEARGKAVADTAWTAIAVLPGAVEAESFALADGVAYEFQVRHATVSGRGGAWTASATLTPVADDTVPDGLTAFSATGGSGQANLSITAPADPARIRIDLYATPDGDPFDAGTDGVAVVTPPSGIATPYAIGLAAGDWVLRAIPRNGSLIAGPTSVSSTITVT